jgi:hypothetical protein
MKRRIAAAAVAVGALGGGAAVVAWAQDAPPTVEVTVSKGKITVAGADALKTGPTRFHFTAKGGEKGVVLMRLEEGVTQEEAAAAAKRIRNPNAAEKYGTFVASGFFQKEYAATVNLEDADYAFIDVSKDPVWRGGFRAGPEAGTAVAPTPSATVELRDYRFGGDKVLPAGDDPIRVENVGDVMHHAIAIPLTRRANGKRIVRQIKRGQEPRKGIAGPPGALVEAVSGGTSSDVEAGLRKGRYVLACFLQDTAKSKPHAALGMVRLVRAR